MLIPAKLAASLKKWNAGSGGTALDKVSSEMTAASQSGGMKLFASMKQACWSLSAAVVVADASPRLPSQVDKLYVVALRKLAKAAADCQSAISIQNTAESATTEEKSGLLRRAEAELAAGARDLYRVTVQIAAADRR
jgi:hypothetical protein